MALHDPIPDTWEQLDQLIVARTTAVETDILVGRTSTIRAVAELASAQHGENSLNCDEDEAEALVRAAVLGRSTLVGARIAAVVQNAIYIHVLPLAQQDLADMERSRQESRDESRIDRAIEAQAA